MLPKSKLLKTALFTAVVGIAGAASAAPASAHDYDGRGSYHRDRDDGYHRDRGDYRDGDWRDGGRYRDHDHHGWRHFHRFHYGWY